MTDSAPIILVFTALAAAALSALLVWLVLRNKHQTETAQLNNRLTELNQQYQFSEKTRTSAEAELAELQQQYRHSQTALAAAETIAAQMPGLQTELQESRKLVHELQSQIQDIHSRLAAATQQVENLQAHNNEYGRLKEDYQELQQTYSALQVSNERLHTQIQQERLAYEEKTALVNQARQQRDTEFGVLQAEATELRRQLAEEQVRNEGLATRIEQDRIAHEEKLALLTEARTSLSDQFQNLANSILEEKTKKFNEQNTESLNRLLNPLNERMGQFSQLVQNTYEKEAKERLTLENELKRLQNLNTQLHNDAQALTQALTGTQNKTQGNWGEMILETVLENSGLLKGREYIVQAAGTRTEEDGSTRRLQPDILVNLPDNKQIIIDSKVSLTSYVRHTQAADSSEAKQHLAAHVASIRAHIKGLSLKQYSNIEGINTLDFIFMFIPVEPAYLLALQHDNTLFQECFDKRIMLVGPSTLLATLRTVANIWRNEQQNQNALAIAEEGGKLYDKFVGFVGTLENIGKNLEQAQSQYQAAYKQLSEGRGNLVNRAQKLYKLGAKASKQLEKSLIEQAQNSQEALPEYSEHKADTAGGSLVEN